MMMWNIYYLWHVWGECAVCLVYLLFFCTCTFLLVWLTLHVFFACTSCSWNPIASGNIFSWEKNSNLPSLNAKTRDSGPFTGLNKSSVLSISFFFHSLFMSSFIHSWTGIEMWTSRRKSLPVEQAGYQIFLGQDNTQCWWGCGEIVTCPQYCCLRFKWTLHFWKTIWYHARNEKV